jgi:hypothetical protein
MFAEQYKEQKKLIDPNRKIEAYKNLHRDCWSIRQGGLVKFHCYAISMKNCKFVVRPAGRAKVLREKKKNVHAFVRGYLLTTNVVRPEDETETCIWDNISYNPYKSANFVDDEGKSVEVAPFVDLTKEGVIALDPT